MKNVLLILVAFCSASAMAVISPEASNYRNNLGSVEQKDHIDVKVYNGTGSTLSSGRIVTHNTTDDNGMSVTLGTTEGEKAFCVVVADISAGAVGRCRKYGYISNLAYSIWGGTASAGQAVYHSSDALGGYATRISSDRTFENTAFSIGVVLDAASATGTVEAFIDIK